MVSEKAFTDGLEELLETLPRKGRTSAVMVRVYRREFEHLSDGQWRYAVALALRYCKFMPTPAEVWELLGQSRDDLVDEAWLRVHRAISGFGRYSTVDLGAVENAAIRAMGGWPKLCLVETEELHFKEKEFKQKFSHLLRSGIPSGHEVALPGYEQLHSVLKSGEYKGDVKRMLPPKEAQSERAIQKGIEKKALGDGHVRSAKSTIKALEATLSIEGRRKR